METWWTPSGSPGFARFNGEFLAYGGHWVIAGWWFGTCFSIQLGMESSQLAKSIMFQRGRVKTTNEIGLIHRC